MTNNKARRGHSSQITGGQSLFNRYKGSKVYLIIMLKTVLTAAIIAIAIATVSVAAQEMANVEHSELLMKLMAFISLIIFDVYALVAILKDRNKD